MVQRRARCTARLSAALVLSAQVAYCKGPSTQTHYPEPLAFDLVRGLGARAGEVEMNTLGTTERREEGWVQHWGPEVELAPIDGLAFEVELPHVNRELEALKVAGQLTLPALGRHLEHGVQAIYAQNLTGQSSTDLLYLFGWRDGEWSGITMLGERGQFAPREEWLSLVNASVFLDAGAHTTVGVEDDLRVGAAGIDELLVLPQVHQAFGEHLAVQAGLGVVWRHAAAAAAVGSLRLIVQ